METQVSYKWSTHGKYPQSQCYVPTPPSPPRGQCVDYPDMQVLRVQFHDDVSIGSKQKAPSKPNFYFVKLTL